jgi:N utilization substance protein B
MSLKKRSHSRVLALQALCLFDSLGEPFGDDLDAFLRDGVNYADLGWERPPDAELLSLARTLASGAWQIRARCDELLQQYVPGWTVQRMQPVDRNILRLGLYELLECPGTPYQVVINEAVELARRFGGTDSPAFVNGVLDGVRRGLATAAVPSELPPQAGDQWPAAGTDLRPATAVAGSDSPPTRGSVAAPSTNAVSPAAQTSEEPHGAV